MDIDFKVLRFFLQEFGLTSRETCGDRLRIQKTIYLLQLFNLDLGYRFVWRHRGPYSFSLSEDVDYLFDLVAEINGVQIGEIPWQEDMQVINDRISTAKKFLACKEGFDQLAWLETLASVHYLMYIDYATRRNRDREEIIINDLKQRKPWLNEGMIRQAIEHIHNEPSVKIEYLAV